MFNLISLFVAQGVGLGGNSGIIQVILVLIVLGLAVGLIDRADMIDATFRSIIKIACVVGAILMLLHAFGVY